MVHHLESRGVFVKRYRHSGKYNLSGRRIAAAREKFDVSQEKLAADLRVLGLNMTQQTISRIECGLRAVLDYELKCFSQVFGKSVDWFPEE